MPSSTGFRIGCGRPGSVSSPRWAKPARSARSWGCSTTGPSWRGARRRRSRRRAIRGCAACWMRCQRCRERDIDDDDRVMNRLFTFWLTHRGELAVLLSQHVLLVAISTFVAIAIGLPLGIFAAGRPRLAAPLVGLANIVQTVPSLAMFGFLLPVPFIGGVGARAAIVVLILYGLLPIVRTTIAGLNGIDPSIREAAVAMGMRPRDLLRLAPPP